MSERPAAIDIPPPRPLHRGGRGTPVVLLHGITSCWPIWTPILPELERRHAVLAPTLPGHWGGPPMHGEVSLAALADATEAILDAEGIETAHLVGNSLGGWLAIELGRRGRARSLTGLSPAGGWRTAGDVRRVVTLLSSAQRLLGYRQRLGLRALVRRPRFRRVMFDSVMQHADRVPPADAWTMIEGAAGCDVFAGFMDWVRTTEPIAAAVDEQTYPICIAWGERDKTLPGKRYGVPVYGALPDAEQVTLRGCGHVPMYDDPAQVVHTILATIRRAESNPGNEQEQARVQSG